MENTQKKSSVSRRSFLKSGIILSAGIPFFNLSAIMANDQIKKGDALFDLFQNPPVTSRPFVRWWWNGNKLSEKEIIRELDIMKDAGIGGVEINSIAFPGGPDMDIPSLPWLSPEWINMVNVALKAAEERGMICDIIVGSGWPFGGEFLQGDERSQLLTLTSQQVKGPAKLQLKASQLLEEASPVIHSRYEHSTKELYSFCLAPLQMETFAPTKDLSADLTKEVIEVEIPEGEYILYALVKITGFQAVINGAPGAAGPVLNHLNGEAVQKFLNRMSDNLFPALKDGRKFRAMFCDSMELEGANWCSDSIAEFHRRRGYDLTPYLPFILYKVGHMGRPIEGAATTQLSGIAKEEIERVRYDFFTVCMEMMNDRFLEPYTSWCHQHNVKSRVQAYGREFHPLDASMKVDIPECETWLWHSRDGKLDLKKRPAFSPVNKFVASGARFSGKKFISCEEITNTDMVFNASLEIIKTAGDQSNLSGVTHSILHGFNYSPPEVPFPGWIRYGTYLSARNTLWPYFRQWADYKARLSTVFQESDAFADIAVMHPLADMWTKFGPQRDPFPELLYPAYQYKVWEAIHQNGNACDYISESIIQKASFSDGFLQMNGRKYHTLILMEVETMMPATAEALGKFVQNGGKLILIEKEPLKSPGLKNYKINDEKVQQVMDSIKKNQPKQLFVVEAPDKDMQDMIGWFKKIQLQCDIKPYMQIDKPNPYISQIRCQAGEKEIFFITNCNMEESFVIHTTFQNKGKKAWLWNPETGKRIRCASDETGQKLRLELEPAGSLLVVFDDFDEKQTGADKPKENPNALVLNDWTVHMLHVNGKKEDKTIPVLKDWSTDPETQGFAGELIYEKQVPVNFSPGQYHYLDLGKVYGVSEVTINGQKLGDKWYGRHLYLIPEQLLKASKLMVQVKITTTLGNYLKSSPENVTGYPWVRNQPFYPMGMIGPARLV